MMDTSSQKRTIRRKPMTRAMKDSGIEWIGQIPENWNISKLKNFNKIIMGQSPSSEDYNLDNIGFPFLQGNADFTNLYPKERVYTKSATKFSKPLDILFSVRAPVGEKNIANKRYAIGRGLCAICPMSHIMKYVWYFLDVVKKELDSISSGSTFDSVSVAEIKNACYVFPEITEQQKIADYLDKRCEKIDTAIDNQKQIIEKLKEYKQSSITETVTKGLNPNVKLKDSGIEWIGSIPEHWEIKKLKYLFKIKKNIAGKEGFDILSVTQSGIKIKDISTNEGQIAQDYSKYQIVNINDFIMNHMDLLTGFVDCSHFNGVTSPDYRVFCQIEPTTNSNLYYNYIFQQCYKNKIFYGLGQGVSGLGRWRLPSDMFLNFTLPQPPLSEQKEIAEYLDTKCNQIDEAIKQKEETISKLEEYKKSLIFECVTGKKEVA